MMLKYISCNPIIRRITALILVVFSILPLFANFVSADEPVTEDESPGDETRIISIIPYVEKTENGIAQSVPVSSREDTRSNPNTTFLMIKFVVGSQDAKKYYGNALYIFKLKTHMDIDDLSGQTPITSFIVQQDDIFEYNVKLLIDLSNLYNGEIYSKFVIASKTGSSDEYVSISGARYIDNINCLSNKKDTPPLSLSKKGLEVQMMGEAKILGVEHTTIKIFLNDFMLPEESPNTESWRYEGTDFYFNIEKIAEYDKKIKNFTNDGIKVTAIMLLSADKEITANQVQPVNGGNETAEDTEDAEETGNDVESGDDIAIPAVPPVQYLVHPNVLQEAGTENENENASAVFYGINTETEEGVKYFSALMSFIADRYVREDVGYGRIYNIILGDEIGKSEIYNNCGQIEFEEYIKNYIRALRICDTAIRSRFGGSRVYIPLDNSFASRDAGESGYINKEIIDLLCEYSQLEGNFPWNIAFHAYNDDLGNPETWNETAPENSYSTPVITLKNIEVLCDYINLEKRDYLPDGERRKIMLAEQGYSSGDGTSTEEKINLQAAALVYAYLKIRHLPDITAFIYHRHVDSESETYSYGLWTRETDTVNLPNKKKKIYDVFKYIDTTKEAEQIEFAKAVFGVKSFTELFPSYSDEEPSVISIQEVAVTTLKSTPQNIYVSRFNSPDLSGFMGMSGVEFMNIVKYSGESKIFNDLQSLLVGIDRTSPGDYTGIFKSYGTETLNLSDKRYVGVTMRIDTDVENIESIPLLFVIEGELVPVASEGKNDKEAVQSSTSSSVITSGVVQVENTSEPVVEVNSTGIFEGAANIKPNEDVTVYFDLKDFPERAKINKIKLLINPYVNGYVSDIRTQSAGTQSDEEEYDFNFYVYSIVAGTAATMSALKVFLIIVISLIVLAVVGFAVLVIRARIITYKRRKQRAERRRQQMMRQRRGQTPPPPPSGPR